MPFHVVASSYPAMLYQAHHPLPKREYHYRVAGHIVHEDIYQSQLSAHLSLCVILFLCIYTVFVCKYYVFSLFYDRLIKKKDMIGNLINRPNNRTNLCQMTEKTRITNLQINNSSLPKITRHYRFHTILHLKNHQNFKGVTPFYRFIMPSIKS